MIGTHKALNRIVAVALAAVLGACASNEEKEVRYAMLKPGIIDGKVIAANSEGDIYAFDRASGERVWRTDIEQSISGGVGVGLGMAVVADRRRQAAGAGCQHR
jgi:outer membrane protein assembly factor BamB